jgi:hypothetical protein
MKAARLVALAILMTALVAVAAETASAKKKPVARVAAIQLAPASSGGPQGVAYLKQVGKRLTGWIVVWGLAPGSEHAWHVHGPNGSCTGTQANPVASDDDLVADANGVAFLQFSTTASMQVIKKGFYVNVHELSSAGGVGSGITCGDLRKVA